MDKDKEKEKDREKALRNSDDKRKNRRAWSFKFLKSTVPWTCEIRENDAYTHSIIAWLD